MKRIAITRGKFALVDDADFELLNQYRWYATRLGNTFYAMRKSLAPNRTIYMHREILKLKRGDGKESDHVDHNGLNNQRSNLRICNRAQNNFNQKARTGTSKFKGVSWHKKASKWVAYIQDNGKPRHLGLFADELDAAQAYNIEAQKLYGDFMRLNNVA